MDEAGDSTFPNWPELRRLFTYDELVGKVLQGRYEVVRRLGAGGMGVVFLARHVHLDKLFALKIISARYLDEPEIGRRFLLEAQAASKIDHPNVVGITDFGPPEAGPTFFVMEYLEGEDLARTLAREGPLAWPRALHIVTQIARALAAAHQRGVVHRDIKPQNCLRVGRDGDPDFIKVLDFGLAKILSGTHKSTWTVGGSPGYIAPEIYRGGRTDHRVDIFALGVVLHTLLLGRLPAQAPSDVELPPHAPVLHTADLPAPLRAVIDRATAEDPERRHPSADALLAALADARAALESPSVHALEDMPDRPRARPARRGLLLAASLGGALAVAAAVVSTREASGDAAGPTLTATAADPAPTPASAIARSDDPATTAAPATPLSPAGAVPEGPAPAVPIAPASAVAPDIPAPVESLAPGPAGDSAAPTPSATRAAGPAAGARESALTAPGAKDMFEQTLPKAPVASTSHRPPQPLAPFDPAAARAQLERRAADVRACKADSSFRTMTATVRLAGTVTVSPRGKATVALPPGYDVSPCLERLVAGTRFRPSLDGGEFAFTFLL
ncbi:serine/threonine protein kinase [Nannocystis exedens]|uniref:Serine/threonine protein kinase n=1 Tax=Nannocystis exedens TaxID=54 RepID=A0A1I2B0Y1_9BACT|nr:serine/threonine-protein kinase [Nannocystis exedens]PCC74400.1 serine/threonine protein kinase [Nannocystis exedens]SFE49726.1 serine/threonine protein kinase [Nannocystis exedens]